MNFINYSEAKQEAERLSRVLHRDVEVKIINCDCDYDKTCGVCGGQGYVYGPRFAFCEHAVQEGPDLECLENDCEHKEYLAFCKRSSETEAA